MERGQLAARSVDFIFEEEDVQQPSHSMGELFAQLGLPSDAGNIATFIAAHSPLPESVTLSDAPFWTPAQATFLSEEILGDADWAEVIDELNGDLRSVR